MGRIRGWVRKFRIFGVTLLIRDGGGVNSIWLIMTGCSVWNDVFNCVQVGSIGRES